MSKIYVITKGRYSDHRVVSATLNKETAERIRKELLFENAEEAVEILELEDAVREELKFNSSYLVKFDEHFHIREAVRKIISIDISSYFDMPEVNQMIPNIYGDEYLVKVQAFSMEQAKKTACDIAARYQAEQAGIS